MSTAPDLRAQALERIGALERDLGALALEAARLQGEIAALRAGVEAIPAQPAAASPADAARGDGAAASAAAEAELAGARLVALELVLRGVTRDEAVLRMAVDYPSLDVAALVDEAVAAGG